MRYNCVRSAANSNKSMIFPYSKRRVISKLWHRVHTVLNISEKTLFDVETDPVPIQKKDCGKHNPF
jgi:hypothetical protein